MATITHLSTRLPSNNRNPQPAPVVTDEDIISSKILAKATFEYNGKIHIIAVFERSEYYRFFFLFRSNKRRSPRKSWTYTKLRFGVYGGSNNHLSIDDYMRSSIYRDCSYKVTYSKGVNKSAYQTWHRRIALPLENRVQTLPIPGEQFNYANAVTSRRRDNISRFRKNAFKIR